jgi:folate-binding protein YgfZ
MRLFQTHKKVLSVKNNAAKFLNGLTSNSLDQPHNAFLNINGRIIATFDQVKISDDEFLLAVEAAYVKPIEEHVDRYARLSKTVISVRNDLVYFELDGDYMADEKEVLIPQKKGRLILTSEKLPATVSEDDFTVFRIKNDIPLLGVDYKEELLLNVSETDFASFTKGCYLGQEPISKVHNRSKPTWKLVVKDFVTGKTFGFVFIKNT